ncbi:MAG TPA: uridylate kinase [Chloroflexi bacterium]|nr:uridylate kinase [Chloroflexota bacterium]HHW85784.1 uridylate kinase [Chloroflexota bacterium]
MLVFLKLGGSLITDKRAAETPRLAVIERLAQEIAAAQQADPALQLVIGHGSGSFGHVYGRRYGTRDGVYDAAGWYGYAAVGDAAARLNRLVTAALLRAGIPAWSIQPGALLRCADGRVVQGMEATVTAALARGLTPVVFGDVALDAVRGGTIVSTEEIFEGLVDALTPTRIVLAGEVDGIFTADPQLDPNAQPITVITPATLSAVVEGLGSSHGVDVTGGMRAKVQQSLAMVERQPGLEIIVCSGLEAGHVQAALAGAPVGTRIVAQAIPSAVSG